MRSILTYSIAFILIVLAQALSAQPFKIDGQNAEFPLSGSSLKLLQGVPEGVSLAQIRGEYTSDDWQSAENGSINLGYTSDVVWAHFQLSNLSNQEEWVLEIDYSLLDTLEVFLEKPDGSIQHISTGRSLPFTSRGELLQPNYDFPFTLSEGAVQNYWVRARTSGPLILPLTILSPKAYVQNQFKWHSFYGIYFGWLAVMVFYNLFIFIALRDLNYFYYVLTIVCTLAIFGTVSGYGYMYIFPDSPWINTNLSRITMGFVVISTAIFARNFLNTKKFARWADYLLIGMIGLAVIAMILVITDVRGSATNSVVSIHTIILIMTGVICWRNGNSYARFYVMAWTLYLVGGLLITLRNAGVLPINFWTTHGAEIGSALEVILLSLALSDRYRTIRKEKESLTKKTLRLQQEYSEELEGKVQERTSQLSEANEELNQINEELGATIETVEQQKSEIEQQRDGLEKQQKALEKAYENIRSSITYAERIQKAKLPERKRILAAFPESFVLFKPRDQVSGDFYWFAEVEDKKIIAAVDCTGHGVPGAFMSMIGSELLNEIVTLRKITDPHEILRHLHRGIQNTLRQDETENRDGMDLAICVVDEAKQTLHFGGAKNPLIMVENGEIKQIKGDKMSVGGRRSRDRSHTYTTHTLHWKQSASFYIFSDGFQDQFGGPDGRKFMIRQLRQKLLECSHLPMEEQQLRLEWELDQWLNWPGSQKEKQMDDILVIGFRAKAKKSDNALPSQKEKTAYQ